MFKCKECRKEFKSLYAEVGHRRIHSSLVIDKAIKTKERLTKEYELRQANKFNEFLDNKYTKWYYAIINNAFTKKYTEYIEEHHIIPVSLSGPDTKDNLVKISAREHFICHILLTKMVEKNSYSWNKMIHAVMAMNQESPDQTRYVNSKLYETARINYSKIKSVEQSGEGNSQYGTMWIYSLILRKSKQIKKTDDIPEQWFKGKIEDFDKFILKQEMKRQIKEVQIKQNITSKKTKNTKSLTFKQLQNKLNRLEFNRILAENNKKEIFDLHQQFINSNLTFRVFADRYYQYSYVSLFNKFKKYDLSTNRKILF